MIKGSKKMLTIIYFLVITHNHYDHLDYKTVKELKQKVKHVVCPLGVGEDFEYWGYDAGIVTEMDWWDRKAFADGIVFNCTPARHFSGRKLFDNAKTLWASSHWHVIHGTNHIVI